MPAFGAMNALVTIVRSPAYSSCFRHLRAMTIDESSNNSLSHIGCRQVPILEVTRTIRGYTEGATARSDASDCTLGVEKKGGSQCRFVSLGRL